MGKLFKPSVPKYTPPPMPQQNTPYVPPVTGGDNDGATGNDTATPTEADGADAVREVIRKSTRGRGSTVLTSLRGVLNNDNGLQPRRKSLLGE